jgi:S-adenosylmethionine hydrolase
MDEQQPQDKPLTQEELNRLLQEQMQQSQFYEQHREATTDRTREIEFVNKLKPYKYMVETDAEGNIINQRLIEGDAPLDVLVDYYGLASTAVSLTNIQNKNDEVELEALMNIINMDTRMRHSREWFNEHKNADEDQINLIFKLRLMMSRGNAERQNTITQKNVDTKGFQVFKSAGQNIMDRVRRMD